MSEVSYGCAAVSTEEVQQMAARRDGLRQRREELGFTQEELAIKLGVATTTYRGWELGHFTPRVGHRPRMARVLGVTSATVAMWFDEDRVDAPNGLEVPEWLGHLATLEQGAARILTYEPIVVPGLLQTEAYAMAVERAGPGREEDVIPRVRARIARQAVLFRNESPLELSVLLDEAVLYRTAGDHAVMASQLTHLVKVSFELPSLELRVLPLTAEAFNAAWGSFLILASPGASGPYMACTVDGFGVRYLDRPGEVAAHCAIFEQLSAVALSPADSRDLIATALQERYR
jgi:transcriptional regulator with XRE-family HTH domain